MNRISFHYFADARRTLYDTEYQNMLPLMKGERAFPAGGASWKLLESRG